MSPFERGRGAASRSRWIRSRWHRREAPRLRSMPRIAEPISIKYSTFQTIEASADLGSSEVTEKRILLQAPWPARFLRLGPS